MSLALLQPLALLALAALALPILLHLTRRSEQRPTPFAAVRWLDARVRPKRRLRVHEWLLLLLRLALVALAVLMLARPLALGWSAGPARYVAVAPGLDAAAARAALREEGAECHWLAPGFPGLDEAPPGAVPVASLLRELDARLPEGTRLTVLVPEQLDGLDGERPMLAHALDWRVLPGRSPTAAAARAKPIRLSVRGDDAHALRYLRASVAAWNAAEPGRYTLDAAPLAAPLPGKDAWLFWLGNPTPALAAWIGTGGVAVVVGANDGAGVPVWRDDYGAVLARANAEGAGRRVTLLRALQPDALPQLIDPDFPERLRALYAGEPPPPRRAPAAAIAPASGDSVPPPLAQPIDHALALLLALLFALERTLASGARLRTPA